MLPRGFTTAEKNLPLLESNTILTEVIEAVGYWGRKGGSNAGYDIGTGAYPQEPSHPISFQPNSGVKHDTNRIGVNHVH